MTLWRLRGLRPEAAEAPPAGGGPRRLLEHEGAPEALRRALWLVLAGCTGFYVFDYGFRQPVMALYAVFGALPLILFGKLPGPAEERAVTLLLVLPAAAALVTAGTLLAVRDWAAALGLLAVGFAVSFLAAGGPRPAGPAPALQLYYVLPCFPPYAPEQLGDRLAGITVGILLTIAADLLLWPDPPPAPYRLRLAGAMRALSAYCAAAAGPVGGTAGAEAVVSERQDAERALTATRLSLVPPETRPASVSLRDRGLVHTRAAAGYLRGRIDDAVDDAREADPAAARLLETAAARLEDTARDLDRGTPGPSDGRLRTALQGFDDRRARALEAGAGPDPLRLRQDAAVRAVAEAALLACQAARIALGHRPEPCGNLSPSDLSPSGPFAYAAVSAPAWWYRRIRLHLSPRSVLLQNSVRLAVALAVARLIAGALSLPHGFWVLLAVLGLMRTSAADTRTALVPAVVGTAVGAAFSTALLIAVGDRPLFYAAVTPVAFLIGFTVCPLLRPWWTQAMVTFAMVLLFGQIGAADRGLPAVRVLDVAVGGAIGAVAALLAWPRGAHGQLRGAVADFLDRAGEGCRTVTDELCRLAGHGPDPLYPARRAMLLAQSTYLQYRTEQVPQRSGEPPWGAYMLTGYDVVTGGSLLLGRHAGEQHAGERPAPPSPTAAAELTALAEAVRQVCHGAAENLRGTGSSGPRDVADRAAGKSPAARTLLVADAEAWLTGVARDAARAEKSTSP
ncbi:FUSC family protein [Streptomyces sp. ET3-23]|uniref:FUSC family protein n=1 Tax=Streptomyces sp. ET3-23 TaxID=2885643 RepID=UPI001D11140E|nr:FUSC family protein [Streptomyces sp. ET3-23]MCC2276355.1 FUSC family protein [Streptomyces sp. ET3-23]